MCVCESPNKLLDCGVLFGVGKGANAVISKYDGGVVAHHFVFFLMCSV